MRKYIFALICCVLAVSACEMKDEFRASNVTDLVTAVSDNTLINDYGVSYTITGDETDRLWKKQDRLLVVFDVLNRDYDITLKQYVKSIVQNPSPASEESAGGKDPVEIEASVISGGYVNAQIAYYRSKSSDFLHTISMEYEDQPKENRFNLYLYHNGNGENPAQRDKDGLEKVTSLYSFRLSGLLPAGESRMLYITIYELTTVSGKQEVSTRTYQLYNQFITF